MLYSYNMCQNNLCLIKFVLEIFFLNPNIQVTMFGANCRPPKTNILFAIVTVFVAAAMKKTSHTGFGMVAEAGKIELPLLRERETTGIYIHGF